MTVQLSKWCAQGMAWWLWRNPLYLISAACMAVGARLYLVKPDTPAGDVGVILITLGVLQAYKLAVEAILLVLHASRRSPEDEPSMLLVAALFWTGPLAATVELSARQANEGLFCAIGVALFAFIELLVVRRSLGLRMSRAGQALAFCCVTLVVIAPRVLHVDTAEGTNELFLYAAWWILAATGLLAVGGLRAHLPLPVADPWHRAGHCARELSFALILLAATGTHLYAMNYAFVGHARGFYGAPLLLVLTVLLYEGLAREPRLPRVLIVLPACLPGVAVVMAGQGFDPEVPVRSLPFVLQDPPIVMLVVSAAVYWFGAGRLRSAGLFHFGNLALAGTVARIIQKMPADGLPTPSVPGLPSREAVSLAILGLAAYLLTVAMVRRSRAEAVLGLAVLQVGVCVGVWDDPAVAPFIIGTVACWSVLAVMHLGERWPGAGAMLWPIAAMVGLMWLYDSDALLCWSARMNMALLVGALLALWQLWGLARYGGLALGVGVAEAGFLGWRAVAAGRLEMPTLIVVAAFALLVGAALTSWHKRALLRWLRTPPDARESGASASESEA